MLTKRQEEEEEMEEEMEPRDWKISKISKPLERTNTGNQLRTNFVKQGKKIY
jgi:hypothetical protein